MLDRAEIAENVWRLRLPSYAHRMSGGEWLPYRHIVHKASILEAGIRKGGGRFIINEPPRHGKSLFCSYWLPTWFLDWYPEKRVILTSYSAGLVSNFGRLIRDTLNDHPLSWTQIRTDTRSASEWLTTKGGGFLSTSVGGPITGMGGDLIIVDDPHKNWEEAHSSTFRERVIKWFDSTLLTRAEPGATIIVIQTRWHEEDLTGYLMNHHGDDWHQINMPALAETDDILGRAPGEALCPERFTAEDITGIQKSVGSSVFSGLYQQRPAPEGGEKFKRAWFRYYTKEMNGDVAYVLRTQTGEVVRRVLHSQLTVFMIVDLAVSTATSADYFCSTAWGITPEADLLLLDRFRDRIEAPEQIKVIHRLYQEHKPGFIGIESTAYQLALVQLLSRGDAANGRPPLPVRKLSPDRDKVSRALPAAARMETGQLYWPRDVGWLGEWEHEHLVFPNGKHDDQVDNTAYAVLEVTSGRVGTYGGWDVDLDRDARQSPWRIDG